MFALILLVTSFLALIQPAVSSGVAQNVWVGKAPMSQAKFDLGVAVIDDKIYVIGGSTLKGSNDFTNQYGSRSEQFLTMNEEYDPQTDTWTTKTPMPTARSGVTAVACQGKIYCFGGYLGRTGFRSIGAPVLSDAVEVFDPKTNIWTAKTPVRPQSTSAIFTYGDKIYFIGADSNQMYDTTTDTWTSKTPMPTAEALCTYQLVNDKFYLICRNALQVYDPKTDMWTVKSSLPQVVYYAASIVFNNKVFIAGHNVTQIYNIQTKGWSYGAAINYTSSPVIATEGIYAPKRLYIFGQDPQVYDPKTDRWSSITGLPSGLDSYSLAVVNDKIYVLGGYTSISNEVHDRFYDRYYPFYAPMHVYSYNPQALNFEYTALDYGTIPPKVVVTLPLNQQYNGSSVPLNFTLDRPVNSTSYILDGKDAQQINGNTTISGLIDGSHKVTVYATDRFGNTAASETILFTVAIPTIPLYPIALLIAVTLMALGVMVFTVRYRKLHKRKKQ